MARNLISVETLIEEIRKRPCIWNIHHFGYSDKQLKMKAWQTVCRIFYPQTVECSADESSKIVYIQKKWKSVRDYYTKQKKETDAPSTSSKKRKYIYFGILSFLEANNPGFKATLDNSEGLSTKKNREKLSQDSQENDLDVPEDSSEGLVNTETIKDDDSTSESESAPEERKTEDIDEDEMFLLSLLPSIRKLSPMQKMDFKLEVMGALKKIQFSKNSQ